MNNDQIHLSIIIPVYNGAATIGRCLDSVFSLSTNAEVSYEVIVIDDCSTDDTVDIIQRDYSEHNNLILLRQPYNRRQGAARNRGISIAHGKYIGFVDSDDELIAQKYILILQYAIEHDLDMIAINMQQSPPKILQQKEFFHGMDLQIHNPFWFKGSVAYLYKFSFLRNVNCPFAEDVLFEDTDFVVKHLYYAQKMGYSPLHAYINHTNPLSTIHTISYKHVADFLYLGVRMRDFYATIQSDIKKKSESNDYMLYIYKFADSILDGACSNIYNACRNILKLKSKKEIVNFYERVDDMINRKSLLNDPLIRKFYWHIWTNIVLGHKGITIWLAPKIMQTYIYLKKIGLKKLFRYFSIR